MASPAFKRGKPSLEAPQKKKKKNKAPEFKKEKHIGPSLKKFWDKDKEKREAQPSISFIPLRRTTQP